MNFKSKFTLAFLFSAFATHAQLPDTDIFVFDISYSGDSMIFSNPTNITNRVGYDNQPYFVDDNLLFYTSVRDKQSDIYQYDLASKTEKQITNTPESEYSPQLSPDKTHISVIRVEMDEKTQRICQYNLEGGDLKYFWKTMTRAGYYCWMSKEDVAAFVLADSTAINSNHLEVYGTTTGSTNVLDGEIGRTLIKRTDENALSYISKNGALWWIMNFNWDRFQVEELVPTLEGQEDFCWTPDGILLMGKDGILYSRDPDNADGDWKPVADFSKTEYARFYRLAVSPNGKKLALVTYVGEKP